MSAMGPGTASRTAAKPGRFCIAWSGVQLFEERLCLLQVERVEAFTRVAAFPLIAGIETTQGPVFITSSDFATFWLVATVTRVSAPLDLDHCEKRGMNAENSPKTAWRFNHDILSDHFNRRFSSF